MIGVWIEAGDQQTRYGGAAVCLHRGHVGQALVDKSTVVEGTARFDDLDIDLGMVSPNDFGDGLHELKTFARSCARGDDEMLIVTGVEIDVRARACEEQHEHRQEEYVESFKHLISSIEGIFRFSYRQ